MTLPPTLVTQEAAKLALARVIAASRTHSDPRHAADLGKAATWLQALLASNRLSIHPGEQHD